MQLKKKRTNPSLTKTSSKIKTIPCLFLLDISKSYRWSCNKQKRKIKATKHNWKLKKKAEKKVRIQQNGRVVDIYDFSLLNFTIQSFCIEGKRIKGIELLLQT